MEIKERILQRMIEKWMKRNKLIKRTVGILVGLMLFYEITHALNRMYVVYDNGNIWCRILWHYFYEDAGKIDNLYLGSSHVYCDLDPVVLNRLNGQYNFNLATPGQPLNGSYYLLREADCTNKLSHVYLELYYYCNYNDVALLDYSYNWWNTDHMKPSMNRAAYRFAIGGPEQYTNIWIPFTRYRVSLGDWGTIKDNMGYKQSDDYATYHFEMEYEDGNGKMIYERGMFLNCTREYKDSLKFFYQNEILTDYSMEKRNEAYLRGIITYCKEKEIPITLFVSPIYDLQLISTMNYNDYVLSIKKIAEEYGVPYYDFNLVKEEYLPIQDGKYFLDAGHLNQYGAEKFTPFFYQVVSGEETDNERYFYHSYEERLRESAPTVYGIYAEPYEEGDESNTLWIASNRGTEMEYRITLKPDGNERCQIQDFQVNMKFQVPVEEHGICTIAARVKEEPTKMQTMSIRY